MNCHCFRAVPSTGGGMGCPFNFNLSCASFSVSPTRACRSGKIVATGIEIAGSNGCTKGRIIRMCCDTPRKGLNGPGCRLYNFAGASLLGPNRAEIVAIGFGIGSVTSFSSVNLIYGSTCMLRSNTCSVCVNGYITGLRGMFAFAIFRSAIIRRLSSGYSPGGLAGHLLPSNACRTYRAKRCRPCPIFSTSG